MPDLDGLFHAATIGVSIVHFCLWLLRSRPQPRRYRGLSADQIDLATKSA
jgi:hypothetical protein